MLITVVGVVFITLAVVLFYVGNFKCTRVLVPIIAVAMSMGIWLDALSEKGKSKQIWNDEIMGYIDLYRCSFLICEII